MWSTLLAINRRLATTASDITTSNILQIQSLYSPTVQEISPKNFSGAFDSIIYPLGSTMKSTYCSVNGVNSLLTTAIFTNILLGQYAATSTIPLNYLRNLFATPLILFNPVTSVLGPGYPSIDNVQPGLAPENYMN